MSTRGCVAVGTVDKWKGVYNHYDSYPSGLGEDLAKHIAEQTREGKTLREIGDAILKFDDWRNYLAGGVCEYCGKMTGQAHSISGAILGVEEPKPGEYPDPEAKHHKHNDLSQDGHITSERSDPLFIEYVYVIDPDANAVHVLAHKNVDSKVASLIPQGSGPQRLEDGSWDYGHCVYKHVYRGELKDVLAAKGEEQ